MSWKNKALTNIIAAASLSIAVIFSFISTFRDCRQDHSFKKLEYISLAERDRPKLTPMEKPSIDSFCFEFPRDKVSDAVLKKLFTDSMPLIPYKLVVSGKFGFINRGSSNAKVFAYMFTDKTSGKDFFRKILLDKELRKKLDMFDMLDYYSAKEVLPLDTFFVDFYERIDHEEDSCFTLHVLILYEGEIGAEEGGLYDTYLWERYQLVPFIGQTVYVLREDGLQVGVKFAKKDIKSSIRFFDCNSSYYIYGLDEKTELMSFFKSAMQDIKAGKIGK